MWWWWSIFAYIPAVFSTNSFTFNTTNDVILEAQSIAKNLYNYDYSLDEEIGPEVLVDPGLSEQVLSAQRRPGSPKRGFKPEEEAELLRLHNLYRSKVHPPAGNMLFMEWDIELALSAQQWADNCKFRHGFPPGSSAGAPMGQNLYRGPDEDGTRATLLWNEEYVDYDLKLGTCIPKKQCGHYTQIAWAKSKRVGCGIRKCGPDFYLIVCHYSPAGNVHNVAPYYVGKPCSQCIDGCFCTTNLCVTYEQCEKNNVICEKAVCGLQCQNCGVLDMESCRCHCTPGWDSADCSVQCRNERDNCGKSPGWPTETSCSMNHFAVRDLYCRKMCHQCNGLDDGKYYPHDGTCCAGIVCSPGYVLDLERRLCKCRLLCPGPLCHDNNTACEVLHIIDKSIFFLLLGVYLLTRKYLTE